MPPSQGRSSTLPKTSGILILFVPVIVIVFAGADYARNALWESPVRLWQDVVGKSPNKARPHHNLGLAYQERGRFDDAINEYGTALYLKSDHEVARYNLGHIYDEQGRLEEALTEYAAALAIKPDYADAHINMANVYMKLNMLDEAIRHYERAVGLDTRNEGAHFDLGVAYERKGLYEEALVEYEEALRISPGYNEANAGRVSLMGRMVRTGHPEQRRQ